MIPLRCIYCGEEAEFIVGGQSVCIIHAGQLEGDVPFEEDFLKNINEIKEARRL